MAKHVWLSVIGITKSEESPLISTRRARPVGMAQSGSHQRSVASHDLWDARDDGSYNRVKLYVTVTVLTVDRHLCG